jgi:hypothetical protein
MYGSNDLFLGVRSNIRRENWLINDRGERKKMLRADWPAEYD